MTHVDQSEGEEGDAWSGGEVVVVGEKKFEGSKRGGDAAHDATCTARKRVICTIRRFICPTSHPMNGLKLMADRSYINVCADTHCLVSVIVMECAARDGDE